MSRKLGAELRNTCGRYYEEAVLIILLIMKTQTRGIKFKFRIPLLVHVTMMLKLMLMTTHLNHLCPAILIR